jgi:hypothetical protein
LFGPYNWTRITTHPRVTTDSFELYHENGQLERKTTFKESLRNSPYEGMEVYRKFSESSNNNI